MQQRSSSNLNGIDISHYQGNVDWTAVKGAGIQFVFCKSSEGATYVDPNYSSYVTGARTVGIPVGAYHFARPNQTSAADEAKNFITQLLSAPTDLLPVLDLEEPTDGSVTPDFLVIWVRSFVKAVTAATGKQVMLYTGNWFMDIYKNFNNQLFDLPLWIANYSTTVPDQAGWTTWVCWQYTDKGIVAGISSSVDMDVAESLDALKGNFIFAVYQYDNLLKYFVGQDQAITFAQQWDHSSVRRIADQTWIWDNYPVKQYRIFSGGRDVGDFNAQSDALSAGWTRYNAGDTGVYMITPTGDKYTYVKHQADNPANQAPTAPPATTATTAPTVNPTANTTVQTSTTAPATPAVPATPTTYATPIPTTTAQTTVQSTAPTTAQTTAPTTVNNTVTTTTATNLQEKQAVAQTQAPSSPVQQQTAPLTSTNIANVQNVSQVPSTPSDAVSSEMAALQAVLSSIQQQQASTNLLIGILRKIFNITTF